MLRLSVCPVVGLVFLACGLLVAADKEKPKEVQGKIVKLDVKKRILVITTKEGKKKEFTVAKDVKIAKGDMEAKLSDLKKGNRVMLVYEPGKSNGGGKVTEIRVITK